MARAQNTYSFRKGDEFTLDEIINIQGLGGGGWWEKIPDGGRDLDMSEFCRCTRDIKITVVVEADLNEFDERLLRLKLALGLTKDQEVATALGLSKAALSNRKQLGSFPVDDLFLLRQQRPELDCVHVLTGKKLEPMPEYLLAAIRCLARAPDVEPGAVLQFVEYVEQTQRLAAGPNAKAIRPDTAEKE